MVVVFVFVVVWCACLLCLVVYVCGCLLVVACLVCGYLLRLVVAKFWWLVVIMFANCCGCVFNSFVVLPALSFRVNLCLF